MKIHNGYAVHFDKMIITGRYSDSAIYLIKYEYSTWYIKYAKDDDHWLAIDSDDWNDFLNRGHCEYLTENILLGDNNEK